MSDHELSCETRLQDGMVHLLFSVDDHRWLVTVSVPDDSTGTERRSLAHVVLHFPELFSQQLGAVSEEAAIARARAVLE